MNDDIYSETHNTLMEDIEELANGNQRTVTPERVVVHNSPTREPFPLDQLSTTGEYDWTRDVGVNQNQRPLQSLDDETSELIRNHIRRLQNVGNQNQRINNIHAGTVRAQDITAEAINAEHLRENRYYETNEPVNWQPFSREELEVSFDRHLSANLRGIRNITTPFNETVFINSEIKNRKQREIFTKMRPLKDETLRIIKRFLISTKINQENNFYGLEELTYKETVNFNENITIGLNGENIQTKIRVIEHVFNYRINKLSSLIKMGVYYVISPNGKISVSGIRKLETLEKSRVDLNRIIDISSRKQHSIMSHFARKEKNYFKKSINIPNSSNSKVNLKETTLIQERFLEINLPLNNMTQISVKKDFNMNTLDTKTNSQFVAMLDKEKFMNYIAEETQIVLDTTDKKSYEVKGAMIGYIPFSKNTMFSRESNDSIFLKGKNRLEKDIEIKENNIFNSIHNENSKPKIIKSEIFQQLNDTRCIKINKIKVIDEIDKFLSVIINFDYFYNVEHKTILLENIKNKNKNNNLNEQKLSWNQFLPEIEEKDV